MYARSTLVPCTSLAVARLSGEWGWKGNEGMREAERGRGGGGGAKGQRGRGEEGVVVVVVDKHNMPLRMAHIENKKKTNGAAKFLELIVSRTT